jgi:hypothetical protein
MRRVLRDGSAGGSSDGAGLDSLWSPFVESARVVLTCFVPTALVSVSAPSLRTFTATRVPTYRVSFSVRSTSALPTASRRRQYGPCRRLTSLAQLHEVFPHLTSSRTRCGLSRSCSGTLK